MDNIIINFTAETAGLKPGIDGLVQLKQVDQQLGEQLKKTVADMNKRDQELSTSAKASKKDVEGLTTAFGNLSKSAVGGTYNKALKELTMNLKGTKDEFKQLSLVLDVAKQKLSQTKPDSKEWADLSDQIRAGEEILQIFGTTTEQTGGKVKSLRTELRQMKEEIAQRTVAGETGPELDALIQKAGELDDALKDVNQQVSITGSDTRTMEGFIQVLGAGTAAISGLQAAQSLLGDENAEFEKVLVKLNALMLVSNSLQTIHQAILKESAAVDLVTTIQRRAGALATQLQTAAESQYVVVRYGAIAAQKILNAVMTASPAGILLTAIGAVAAAVLYFTNTTNKAAEAQKRLNDDMENAIEINDRYNEAIDRSNEITLEKMKLQGASEQQLREQELRNIKNQLDAQTALENNQRDAFDKAWEIRKTTKERGAKIDKEALEQAEKTIESFEKISAKRLELEDKYALKELQNKVATKEEISKFDEEVEANREAAFEKEKAAREKRLAEIQSLGDRDRKARQEMAKLELEDQKRSRESVLDSDTTAPAAKLRALEESFAISRRLLEQEKAFALQNEKLTGEERKLVVAKYLSDLAQLEQENGKRVVEILKESGEAERKAVAEALEKRKAEIEKNRNSKISPLADAIEENKYILENVALTEKERGNLRQETLNKINALERQQNIKIAELYEANAIDFTEAEKQKTQAARDAARERRQLEEEEYNAKVDEIEKRLRKQKDAVDAIAGIENVLFEKAQANSQKELDFAQKQYDKKLITEEEFNKRREQIAKQDAQRRKQQAIFDIGVELAKAIFQVQAQAAIALANPVIAVGIANAARITAQIPFLIGESALAIGLVAAKKYRHGKIGIDGPGTETSDSIPAWLSKNESIVSADMTKKHRLALEAINNNKFQDYLVKHELPKWEKLEMPKMWNQFDMPTIPQGFEQQAIDVRKRHLSIDYAKLASVIAEKLQDYNQVSINMDQEGFNVSVQQGLDTIAYKNKKAQHVMNDLQTIMWKLDCGRLTMIHFINTDVTTSVYVDEFGSLVKWHGFTWETLNTLNGKNIYRTGFIGVLEKSVVFDCLKSEEITDSEVADKRLNFYYTSQVARFVNYKELRALIETKCKM